LKKLASLGESGGSGGLGRSGGWAGLGAALALVAVLAARGHAADHVNSPSLATNPMADLTDVYAWMTGATLNLVMDLSPGDDGTHSFGPAVTYVFHLTSKAGLGVAAAGGTETRVIVRFDSGTSVKAWVTDATGTKDYAAGDPSATTGIASTRGQLRIFAGRRSDPFFFNATGFGAGVAAINAIPAVPPPDGAGCPSGLAAGTALGIRNQLGAGADGFATGNVMAIVVQLDRSLVNTGANTTVAVWGSSHAGT